MAAELSGFMEKFRAMPTKKRGMVVFGGIFLVVILAAISMSPSEPVQVGKKKENLKVASLSLPGTVGKDLSIEKLSATLESFAKEQKTTRQELDATKKELIESKTKRADSASNPQSVKEIEDMRKELKQFQEKFAKANNLDEALPVSGGIHPVSVNSEMVAGESVEEQEPKIRIIGSAPQEGEADHQEEQTKKNKIAFLPGGTQFDGYLLNGMEAPTSAVAKKNPIPVTIRIKTDAILPNLWRYDVKECMVIATGHGELSTARVNLKPVSLSCIKKDGAVIETDISAYAVGEDGLTGIPGDLKTRQGQLIARSFVAGFAGGVANSMAPTTVPQLNTSPGSTQQFQVPDVSAMAAAGTARGISESAREISKFYLDMAKEMYPTVVIGSNRKVTVMLQKGVELNFSGGRK